LHWRVVYVRWRIDCSLKLLIPSQLTGAHISLVARELEAGRQIWIYPTLYESARGPSASGCLPRALLTDLRIL
jgi:hypothetical protein